MSLRGPLREAVDLGRYQSRALALSLALLAVVYSAAAFVEPGRLTSALMIPPCVVMLLTALARVNDIGPEHMGWVWQVRRLGLVLAGSGAVMYMFSPWTEGGAPAPWRAVTLAYGVALAWLTTPVLPPWWDYITGRYRAVDGFRAHLGRFTGAGRKTGEMDAEAFKRRLRDEGEQ